MQAIFGSVGDGGANGVSDVALVQAILVKTQRPAKPGAPAGPYLASYDGACGPQTKEAIRTFQGDHVFVSPNGLQSMNNPLAKPGVVAAGDATWVKLLEKVPQAYVDLRVLPGGKTVYLAASEVQLKRRTDEVATLAFERGFRAKVVACITRVHALHGLAVGVCRDGARRTFQTQYDLLTSGRNVTRAGPGESNHNFGMAVDLGFHGLRWLQKDGTIVEDEDSWLHRLDPKQTVQPEALRFWDALRSAGTSTEVGLFRGPEADRPHLQNWNDAGVDMAARLANLLARAGTMRWTGARQRYQCDLGYGGHMFEVGSAQQIWSRQATVTIGMIAQARMASSRSGRSAAPPARPGTPPGSVALPSVRASDVTDLQAELRRQFDLADAAWATWTDR